MTSTTSKTDRLLILDDVIEIAELIGGLGEQAGFLVTVTTDIDAFNTALEKEQPSVIALDLQMPRTDGIEVLRRLAASACMARVLLITGMDRQTTASAKRFGQQLGLNILGTVQKPFDPESLIDMLSRARNLSGVLSPDDLANAIRDTALILRYQPVIRRLGPQSWHAESVEALPRWHHPEFGVLTPRKFLPLIASERSELMRHLTDYVLQQSAQQLQQWQSSGLHLGLRVNLPAGLITDTEFPDRLECLFDECAADSALLTLELSDVSALVNSRDCIEILTRLRLKGIKLSLDDFGISGSSLQALYALPITEAKIDRRLTSDLVRESGAELAVGGILQLLKALDIDCCAEGVESSEQMNTLDELECDLLQGFYIGTPMPAADIPKALESWTTDASRLVSAGS